MFGGARRDRTDDLLRARQALSQLSYGPLLVFFALCVVALVAHSVTYQLYAPSFTPACASPNTKNPYVSTLSK